jgi:hypothetical protein
MKIDSQMICFSHSSLHISVGAHTSGFQGFTGDVFSLEKDDSDAIGEDMRRGRFGPGFIALDTGVRDTAAEARLRVRTGAEVAVATSRAATHGRKAKTAKRSEIERLDDQ